MIPWQTLGKQKTPGGGDLVLLQRAQEFRITIDGRELMSSRQHGSEEDLAKLACAGLFEHKAPRVLVGGLGLGYTLRTALDLLPRSAEVTVAELVPAVIEWNRGPLAPLAASPLSDPRVTVYVGDVLTCMRKNEQYFDAILLDVDNGPSALVRKSNWALYGTAGVQHAFKSLIPGGRYAVWSAYPDDNFGRRLALAGFAVQTHMTRARGGSVQPGQDQVAEHRSPVSSAKPGPKRLTVKKGGARHTIFVGTVEIERPERSYKKDVLKR